MDVVRIGVIGIGNMGSGHVGYLAKNAVKGAKLGAVCDVLPDRAAHYGRQHDVPHFTSHTDMLKSGAVDAVIVATPHYDHPPICLDSFAAGLHVMCEKPLAVTVGEGRKVIAAAANYPKQKFAIMFNQRTNPMYQKLRRIIAEGELGEITRVTWLMTDWFRTWTYYASGGWRATWAGEGGGVILNQCPHQLDLLQWVTGIRPNRITAVGFIGKRHPIEVDDEISAILEYPNGAIGHFVTSTGEAPGTNRLEIAGDQGKIIAEKGKLSFRRSRKSVKEILEKSPKPFEHVECWDIEIPVPKGNEGHSSVTQDWVNSILTGSEMICNGVEGIHGLEIGNAMLMSGLTRQAVDLPVDAAAYDAFLADMTKRYGGRKALPTIEGGLLSSIETVGQPL